MDRAVFQLYPAFAYNGGLQDGQQPAEDRGPGSPKSTEQRAARGDVEEGGSCCFLMLMTQEHTTVAEESRSQAAELFYPVSFFLVRYLESFTFRGSWSLLQDPSPD